MPTSVWQRSQNERVEDTFIRGILWLTEATRWNIRDEIMGELKEAWVCKSPSAPGPVLNNPSRLIFHVIKHLLIRKQLKLFCLLPPGGNPCFLFFRMLVCVMSFSGRPSWKNGEKTSCNNGQKRETSFSFSFFFFFFFFVLSGARDSLNEPRPNTPKVQKSIEIHKQFGTAAHTYPPFTNLFFYVRFTWHCPPPPARRPPPPPPSLHPEPTRLIDRVEWEQHITVPRCSLPHHFHYIVILNYQQRWTGKDDWHIPASGAATAWLSSVSWQAPLYAVPDGRGLAKCLAKGLH